MKKLNKLNKPKLFTANFMIITLVHLLVAITFYLLMVVIASYAMESFQASPSQGGLASSIFLIGGLIARVFSGKWVDRIGRKKMLLVGLISSVLISGSYFTVSNIPGLLLVRLLHGCAFGIATTATMTIAANIIPAARYGEGIAYFMMSATVATAIGPFIGMLLIQYLSFTAVFIFCATVSVLAFFSGLILKTPEVTLSAEELNSLRGFKPGNFIELSAVPISAICGTIFLCYSSVMSFVTAYAQEIQLFTAASFFFVISASSALISRPLLGMLFDRKGENYIMYPTIAAFAAGLLIISRANSGFVLLLTAVLIGSGSGAVQSCTQAIALKAVPAHRKGITNATVFTFVDFGVGIGPFLFGFIIPWLGYRGLYLTAGLIALACLLIYHFVHGRKV